MTQSKERILVDFRTISNENQAISLDIYKERLSDRPEAYTDTDEISNAIKNDSNFYIWVLLEDKIPIGHIQFKYLKLSNVVLAEYMCMSLSASKEATKMLYTLFFLRLDEVFINFYVVSEATFFDKKRNNALARIFKKQGMHDLGFTYIQPPTEMIFPVTGKLLIKNVNCSDKYDIHLIIKDIYFNHYKYWYREKKIYKYYIFIGFFIQKLFLLNYKNINFR